jgi:hypothetical protein
MAASAPTRGSTSPITGLSIEETLEFQMLDALPATDENGDPAWTFEGEPTNDREKRWLTLYLKQMDARPVGFGRYLSWHLPWHLRKGSGRSR